MHSQPSNGSSEILEFVYNENPIHFGTGLEYLNATCMKDKKVFETK
jgi:hypothetical protein